MPNPRDVLLGLLGLQNGLIDRSALARGFNRLSTTDGAALAECLLELSALTPEALCVLEGLVSQHLAAHGNDVHRGLAALCTIESVREELDRLYAPEIQATLLLPPSSTTEDEGADTDAIGPLSRGSEGDRFQILRAHAEGGLGRVFVARDIELNREVALKQIKEEHADHAESRMRFQLEAEVTGRLEHPGIVPVYGLGRDANGRPFYAMRFIQGESLKDEIERFHGARSAPARSDAARGKTPPSSGLRPHSAEYAIAFRKLLQRFIDVCEAVQYAHSRGVLHRDLKPANVMVGRYGETLVVDWGLAKVIGVNSHEPDVEGVIDPDSGSGATPTVVGSAVGTPAYMSPEQAAGRVDSLGPASDVYSLGATLYAMLTGRPPFESGRGGVVELLARVTAGDFPRPREVRSSVPKPLDAICLKAMALQPDRRYHSARALADEIERFLADEPLVAFPDTLAERTFRLFRKNRGYVQAGLISLVLITMVSLAANLLINEQKRLASRAADDEREARKQTNRLLVETTKLADEKARLADSEKAARNAAEDREQAAVQSRYLARMTLARQVFERSEIAHVLELLAKERPQPGKPDHRTFLWHFLWRACHQDLMTLDGHDGSIWSIAASPAGRVLASAGADGTIRLWDLATGIENRVIQAGPSEIQEIAFAPDGNQLASAGKDGVIRFWNPGTGEEISVLTGHRGSVNTVSFSPDGKLIASGGVDRTIRVWNRALRSEVASVSCSSEVNDVTFSPDGARVAAAVVDSQAVIWTVSDPVAKTILSGHLAPLVSVCFSRDGARLATGSQDMTIRIWDVSTGNEVGKLTSSSPVRHAEFNESDRCIVAGHRDGSATYWELDRQLPLMTVRGHAGTVDSVAMLADNVLATGSRDRSIKLWKLPGLDQLRIQAGGESLYPVVFSPDGRHLATGGTRGPVRLWDPKTGRMVLSVGEPQPGASTSSLAFSPDGRRLAASYSNGLCIQWDAETGQEKLRKAAHQACIQCITFSQDGQRIATCGDDRVARVWNAMDMSPHGTTGAHRHVVDRVAFLPGGETIATVSRNGTAYIWDPMRSRELARFHTDGVMARALAVSPDGRTVAVGTTDFKIRLWDVASRSVFMTLLGHTDGVESLAFASDGSFLVSGSNDGTVRVWDVRAALEVAVFSGHRRAVDHVALSGDDCQIASVGPDPVLCVWHLERSTPELFARGSDDPVEVESLRSELFELQRAGAALMKPGFRKFSIEALEHWRRDMALRLDEVGSLSAPRLNRTIQMAKSRVQQSDSVLSTVTSDTAGFETLPVDTQWSFLPFRLQFLLETHAPAEKVLQVLTRMEDLAQQDWRRLLETASWAALAAKRSASGGSADGRDSRAMPFLDVSIRLLAKVRSTGVIPQMSWLQPIPALPIMTDLDALVGHERLADAVPGAPRQRIPLDWKVEYFSWPDNGPLNPPADWSHVINSPPITTTGCRNLAFEWGARAPEDGVPADHFAVVASSRFSCPGGSYTLEMAGDDGFRAYLDGELVLDHWDRQAISNDRISRRLAPGEHTLKVEYFESDGVAKLTANLFVGQIAVTEAPRISLGESAARFDLTYVSRSGEIVMVDTRNGRSTVIRREPSPWQSVDWVSGGGELAARQGRQIIVLDPRNPSKRRVLANLAPAARHLAVHPSARLVGLESTAESAVPTMQILDTSTGQERHVVRSGYDPSWSADGNQFLALDVGDPQRRRGAISVFASEDLSNAPVGPGNADGWPVPRQTLEIPVHPSGSVYPVLSPDGKSIAFGMLGDDQTRQIGLLDVADQKVTQVTKNNRYNLMPSFSPDGRFLAYLRGTVAPFEVAVYDLEAKREHLVAGDGEMIRPVWRTQPLPEPAAAAR